MLRAYVSGHGFGHATRTAEVLRAVRERDPKLPIAIISSAPEFLFRSAIRGPLEFERADCDVGLVQASALAIDEPGTARRWREFERDWPGRLAAEQGALASRGVRLVLGDIPPLAFAAAAEAGRPGVGLANFSWDWIYRHLGRREAALLGAADHAAQAYRCATQLLELPFSAGLEAFPRRQPIPLVARRPRVDKREARRRLGLDGRPAVLLSFGGLGLPALAQARLAGLGAYQFLCSEPLSGAVPLTTEHLAALDLGYPDVVGAADVVVTKPGYGIVSDCIGARTGLVYTERGDFPEYPLLVAGIEAHLPSAHVDNSRLLAGDLTPAIEGVLAQAFPDPPAMDGAERAAERLLALLG
jgi:L-arabinokinase